MELERRGGSAGSWFCNRAQVKGVPRRCLKGENLREDLEFVSHAILHPPSRVATNHFNGRF